MTELLLRLAGISLILLAAIHVFFPKRFRWREEFSKVSLLNRQIFYVHCFFICLVLFLMGALCAARPLALLEPTPLGVLVSGGLAVFWLLRLAAQWFFYDSKIWRGRPFETLMHWLFSVLWAFYSGLFGFIWWSQWINR